MSRQQILTCDKCGTSVTSHGTSEEQALITLSEAGWDVTDSHGAGDLCPQCSTSASLAFCRVARQSPLQDLYLDTLASVYEAGIDPGAKAHREGRVALVRDEILRQAEGVGRA